MRKLILMALSIGALADRHSFAPGVLRPGMSNRGDDLGLLYIGDRK
jgi:hypothetical protein